MISQIQIINYFINYISGFKYRNSEFGVLQYNNSPILKEKQLQELLPKSNWTIKNGNFDKYGGYGKGVNIAVIDTGVDPFHYEFKNVIPLNFTKEELYGNKPDYYDNQGHGTFVVGLLNCRKKLMGVVPESTIYSMKVINFSNPPLNELEKNISNAIDQAIKSNCKIITVSLGTPHKSKLIEEKINKAVSKGTLIFAAAGNEGIYGSRNKSYPASYENVISVASADERGLPVWFSTMGMGEDPKTQPEAAIASLNYHIGCIPNNRYAKMFGTSFACPIMAGIGAKWISNNYSLKNDETNLSKFREWIKNNTIDSNNNEWDNSLGYGVIKLNKESF